MSTFIRTLVTAKRRLLLTAAALFILCVPAAHLSAQQQDPYVVRNEAELFNVLETKADADGITDVIIRLEDNVFVSREFEILAGSGINSVTFELNDFNLQGDGQFLFINHKSTEVKIIIDGSTAGFNGGLQLEGIIDIDYRGLYTSTSIDILAAASGDEVTFNLTRPGIGWNSMTAAPTFIDALPALPAPLTDIASGGTIIIGGEGQATMNVTNGNWVRNAETIVGARLGSEGELNISGSELIDDPLIDPRASVANPIFQPTTWWGVGTFYIGYEGNGTVNVSEQAKVYTGSIGIGLADTGEGVLNVIGIAESLTDDAAKFAAKFNDDTTTVLIFGRDKGEDIAGDHINMHSSGAGVMNITEGAHLRFDVRATETGDKSGFDPKLTLGSGESFVNNSLVSGALRDRDDEVYYPMLLPKLDHFTKLLMEEGANAGVIDGLKPITPAGPDDPMFAYNDNSLTFTNNSWLEGDMTIRMEKNIFEDYSVLSPGTPDKNNQHYYHPFTPKHEKTFGQFVFDNKELWIGGKNDDRTVTTYIDFSVRGDQNCDPNYANFPPTGYHFDKGRDVIYSSGDVHLYGTVFFRPQAGYYNNSVITDSTAGEGGILVSFLRLYKDKRVEGNTEGRIANFDTLEDDVTLIIEPSRWFHSPKLVMRGDTPDVNGRKEELEYLSPYDYLIMADEHLFLQMERTANPFTDPELVKGSFNLKGVGGALEKIYNGNNNLDWLHILDWVWLMDDDELRRAMHLLSGESRASSLYMPVRSPWRLGFDRVSWSQNGNAYFGVQNSKDPSLARNALWAASYYDYSHFQASGTGYATTSQRVSFMSGYDRVLWRNNALPMLSQSAFGVVFGYTQPNLNQGPSRVLCDDFLVGAHFASRLYNRYELKLWAGVGAQQYRINRHVPIPFDAFGDDHGFDGNAYARLTGNTFSWSAEVAAPFRYQKLIRINTRKGDEACTELDDRFKGLLTCVFRPFAAVDLNYVRQNGAVERGTYDQILLRYHAADWAQVFGRIGVKTEFDWKKFNLHTSLSYSCQPIGHAAPRVRNEFEYVQGTSPFRVQGNYPGRSFLNFSLGTQIKLGKKEQARAFLQYHGDYGAYSNVQTATLGYQFLF